MKIEEAKIRFEEIETYTHGFYDDVLIKKRDAKVLLDQLDQPKPVVPKFVADWIEECKEDGSTLFLAYDVNAFSELAEWLYDISDSTHIDLFAQAWLAYPNITVEKEKLYTVEIPNPNAEHSRIILQRLIKNELHLNEYTSEDWKEYKMNQLTEQEIRKDFDWAFRFAKEVTE